MIYKDTGRKGAWRYVLEEPEMIKTTIRGRTAITDHIILLPDGNLIVRHGYAWDGPSGPSIDTPSFMRGSLFHDALYQLMSEGHLPQDCRLAADKLLRDVCRADGMSWLRAQWVYAAVRTFGGLFSKRDK